MKVYIRRRKAPPSITLRIGKFVMHSYFEDQQWLRKKADAARLVMDWMLSRPSRNVKDVRYRETWSRNGQWYQWNGVIS